MIAVQDPQLSLGVKAYVVLYDNDLSSRLKGFTVLNEEVVEEVRRAWLAILLYKDSEGKCVEEVLREGKTIRKIPVGSKQRPKVYVDEDSTLRRDSSRAKEVCSDG